MNDPADEPASSPNPYGPSPGHSGPSTPWPPHPGPSSPDPSSPDFPSSGSPNPGSPNPRPPNPGSPHSDSSGPAMPGPAMPGPVMPGPVMPGPGAVGPAMPDPAMPGPGAVGPGQARAQPGNPPGPAAGDPAFVAEPTVVVSNLSIWFGQKVALSELSCAFGPGVTGLLGPNGAGKTTLMRAMCGLIAPREGTVEVLGVDPRRNRNVHARVSMVPEEDAVPGSLSARQLVRYQARLCGDDPGRVEDALRLVDLHDVADRTLRGFSKGMRQRAKIAAALVSMPSVLVLDEPLNGADPVQRLALIELFHRLGDLGTTVVVSSHVLHEVERLARRVVVVVRGRLAAAGDHHAIRDAMADVPRRVMVRSSDDRRLAAALIGRDPVRSVEVHRVGTPGLTLATTSAAELATMLPRTARDLGISLHEVLPLDDSLESTFAELTR